MHLKTNLSKILLICIFALLHIGSLAQSRLRISLLTCTPGQELSETFGHSALRVIDSNSVTDNVYNYGTFPFYEKGFYLKFIRGKLRYSVDVEPFFEFKQNYQLQNRGITEQVLNFSNLEKKTIYHALLENIKEENKYYQYDFFLDNCTTRLRDIIEKYHQPKPILPAVMPTNTTFRNAIHQYLNNNNDPWSKLGIDILLGAKTDAIMTTDQQKFLPDNLMHSLYSTKNTTMVEESNQLYFFQSYNTKANFFTPFFLAISLLSLFIILSLFKSNAAKKAMKYLDKVLFAIIALLSLLLIFMWVGTDHSMTKNNYNLLWASPIFIIFPFIKKYYLFVKFFVLYMIVVLFSWYWLPQLMNNAILPIVALLAWRLFIYSKFILTK